MLSLPKFFLYRARDWRPGPDISGRSDNAAVKCSIDDLTKIRGICVRTENRLYASGIKTYAKLADASVAEVRDLLGPRWRDARVDEWIAEAGKLVGETNE